MVTELVVQGVGKISRKQSYPGKNGETRFAVDVVFVGQKQTVQYADRTTFDQSPGEGTLVEFSGSVGLDFNGAPRIEAATIRPYVNGSAAAGTRTTRPAAV